MKKFNVTGTCIPEDNYMVDISSKIAEIEKMVDNGLYFTINRPRQYGKTTTMYLLSQKISQKYVVIKTSFEGVGDDMFTSEDLFCKSVFDIFARSVRFTDNNLYKILKGYADKTNNFNELSDNITSLIETVNKDVVLIIDEVDKSSANRVFMQFLAILRNKYLAMKGKEDLTFKSVILGGVHDIKNLKLKIRDEKDRVFNSPWNVAADFKVDMSFSADEIEGMLIDYSTDTGINMDTKLLALEIRKFTNGYPYLVSRICKNIDEYLDKNWTIKGIEESIKMTLNEKSTLFDDVIKNIENNEEIKAVVHEMLIVGRSIGYNPDAYEKGLMYGLFAQNEGKLIIHNKIFEERLYNYLLEQKNIRNMYARFTAVDENQFVKSGSLDMEKCLLKFQEVMYQEYRQEDEKFYETTGRMIFLAYLKPILNGR
ncbi:MAG: AAA-like domain-containing protein, partial [Clostridiales bacterium]|nr:AAA-like domain-containing protein [Clostridiales bacterium]